MTPSRQVPELSARRQRRASSQYVASDGMEACSTVTCVIVLFAGLRLSGSGRALLMLLSAQLGIHLLAYIFSSWSSYEVHIQTSLSRLMLRATPLAWPLCAPGPLRGDRVR